MNWKLGLAIGLLAAGGVACGGEGERGAQGETGQPGDSCSVEQLDGGEARIDCEDGSSATIGGAAAETCSFGQTADGAVTIECGDESVVLPEGSDCHIQATDEGAQVVCDDGTSFDIPTGEAGVDAQAGVSRLAGAMATGHSDGPGLQSRMDGSMSAQFSADGQFLYFLDTFNQTFRRYGMNSDIVVTLVGSPGLEGSDDGVGSAARFEGPRSLAVDPNGDYAYIADGFNCAIRRVDLVSLETTTYAGMAEFCDAVDGPVQASRFGLIIGMTIDSNGDYLYVADRGNDAIRRIDLNTDQVATIAGSLADSGHADGDGEDALFNSPGGIALDHQEERLYVADMSNAVIRVVDLTDPDFATTTVLGDPDGSGGVQDGQGSAAGFQTPQAIVRGAEDDTFYVVGFSRTVRRVTRDAGVYTIETIAGAPGAGGFVDGAFEDARFGVTFNGVVHPVTGDFYYLDLSNDAIRQLDFENQTVTTRVGATADVSGFVDGAGVDARFTNPRGVTATSDGKHIFVADWGNDVIRHYDVARDQVRLLAGNPGQWGFADGLVDGARFDYPYGLALSPDESWLYVSETGNNAIRRIDIATAQVETIAGDPSSSEDLVDGELSQAVFGSLQDIVVSHDGDHLYVVDSGNQRVRHIDLVNGQVATLAGGNTDEELEDPDGVGEDAQFAALGGLVLSPGGQTLYVTDGGQFMGAVHKGVRAIDVDSGEVTTVFAKNDDDFFSDGGDGGFDEAALSRPEHITIDSSGTRLFIADGWGHNLRLVDLADETVSTYLGIIGAGGGINAEHFSIDEALINRPTGITYTPQGLVFTSGHGLYRVSLPEHQ